MVTEVSEKYPRTKKALESLMKIVQRELEDGRFKVKILSDLVDLIERLDNDEKEPSGKD